MNRKKWTPKAVVTDTDIKFRQKRKWQIALRRYILERHPATMYAPYFGLDIENMRKWIELQFEIDMNWESFGSAWQLDHIIPVAYFNFEVEEELKLCWNFTNIRVEGIDLNKNRGNRVDVLASRAYYEHLYKQTGYTICTKMIEKLSAIEVSQIQSKPEIASFVKDNIIHIEALSGFDSAELARINQGESLDNIILEKEILKKFGQ